MTCLGARAALQQTGSEPNLVDHNITPEKLLAELIDGLQKPCSQQRPIARFDTQQDQAWNGLTAAKNKFAEILVGCKQKAFLLRRQRDYLNVA